MADLFKVMERECLHSEHAAQCFLDAKRTASKLAKLKPGGVRGWIIKYPDGFYNSGEGNSNGFPVRLEEATIYKTIEEAETKAKDLGEVEILEAANA